MSGTNPAFSHEDYVRRSLRVAVTPPSGHQPIAERASTELGFSVELIVLPTELLFAQAIAEPSSFDVVQAEYWMLKELRDARSIQYILSTDIASFDDILPIFTDGTIEGIPTSQSGVAPHTVQFADEKTGPSRWLNAVPTICNSDTLGWRQDKIDHEVTSWASLLDPSLTGRVALADVPAVSHVELSLACAARGVVRYDDIGEQSRAEIDATYDVAEAFASQGHFHSLWSSFETSVENMAAGRVLLQSLWPPAVTALKKSGIPVRYEPMSEGARGWAGGFCLSSRLDPTIKTAAISYINWYLSGWAGAYLTRQGYYPSTPSKTRAFLTDNEWDFWQLGQQAREQVKAPDGSIIAKPGERRDGGAFAARMSRIACWSTRMKEDAYLRARWTRFRESVEQGQDAAT